MPVHRTSSGGYQWGGHGKIYHGKDAKKKAAAQGAAAHASGYQEPVKKRKI
jgi:hypothetical protein